MKRETTNNMVEPEECGYIVEKIQLQIEEGTIMVEVMVEVLVKV